MKKRVTDEELIDLYFRRDETALEITRKEYGGYMRSLSYGILANDGDSEECMSDALYAVWQRIPPEKPRCFKAYLSAVVRKLALMKYREKNAKKRVESEYALSFEELAGCISDALDTEKAFENRSLRDLLNEFISSLDEKEKYIFISRYYLSVPAAQIAKELSISPSTVFHDLSVMRNRLKEKLQKEGFENET